MKVFMLRARHLVPAVAALGVMGHAAMAESSNKWRIEFDENVRAGDVIVLNVIPIGGTPVRVETHLPAGTHENQIVQVVRDALRVKLGTDYDIEVDAA